MGPLWPLSHRWILRLVVCAPFGKFAYKPVNTHCCVWVCASEWMCTNCGRNIVMNFCCWFIYYYDCDSMERPFQILRKFQYCLLLLHILSSSSSSLSLSFSCYSNAMSSISFNFIEISFHISDIIFSFNLPFSFAINVCACPLRCQSNMHYFQWAKQRWWS